MKNIGVLMGGPSAEREVSLNSGENVLRALLKSKKYHPIAIIVEKDKSWHSLSDGKKEPVIRKGGKIFANGKNIDSFYIALHGKYGEDGEVQRELEKLNIPFTGPDSKSSELGMDKDEFKKILEKNNISQADYITFKKEQNKDEAIALFNKYKKVVVKPCCEGSSLGVSIVSDINDLEVAMGEAFKYDNKILVEEFIQGRELSCGVIGNTDLTALPPIEIIPKNEFFDYEAKYTVGFCEEICPATITKEEDDCIRKVSKQVFEITGCTGVARIDVFLAENGKVYVIEINTSPGMTSTSLLPQEAAAEGISFEELVEKIVDYALNK